MKAGGLEPIQEVPSQAEAFAVRRTLPLDQGRGNLDAKMKRGRCVAASSKLSSAIG